MSRMMGVVIVEDRSMAREELKYLLSLHPDVEVLGEFENTQTAWPLIASGKVDGVFLDINIATEPGAAGLDLAYRIDRLPSQISPWIVFTTGYEQYALSAHRVSPYGYLVKPLDDAKVTPVLDKVRRTEQRMLKVVGSKRIEIKHKIVKQGETLWCTRYVQPCEILYIQTNNGENSVKVQLTQGEVLNGINLPLSKWKAEYDLPHFMQIHKSNLVNLDYVNGYKPDPFKIDGHKATFRGHSSELPIGKTFLAQLVEALKNPNGKHLALS